LIDWELVKLLRYCGEVQKKYKSGANEDYEDEFMMKTLEIGVKERQKTIIFDMDETLIRAEFEKEKKSDWVPDFKFQLGNDVVVVSERPFIRDVLFRLKENFELCVFTAAQQEYADKILDHIDKDRTLFKKRMYRDDCIYIDGFYVKDLDIIMDRDINDIVIVDNSILAFGFHLCNGIPISAWMGDNPDDQEMLYLASFFEELYFSMNIKKFLNDSFKLTFL
jgi:Dullard-like phosphatase family protein